MTGEYFTADLHLRHEKVAQLRGFNSSWAHDAHILEQIAALPRRSTLWVLGDVTLGSLDRVLEDLALQEVIHERRLDARLVSGNHDGCHPMHRRSQPSRVKHLSVFKSVQESASLRENGRTVLLSHFPYQGAGDHTEEERCEQWRLPNLGAPLIHGHTHQDHPVDLMCPNSVCVSWDAWRGIPSRREVMAQLGMNWPHLGVGSR